MWTYQGKEEESGQTKGGKMLVRRYDRGGPKHNTNNRPAWIHNIISYRCDNR